MTRGEARLMHDTDLRRASEPEAAQVLAGRGRAAQQIRVVMARMYGRPDMSTAQQWQVIPHLTDRGTIGVVDVTAGTAWDSGVEADPGVYDLGLAEDRVHADANVPWSGGAGIVRIDGEVVQAQGTAVVEGQVVHPSRPAGWRQIILPTWRGYDPDADRYVEVPPEEYTPEKWIRPTLAAAHLMTCYGRPGEDDGEYLDATHGWDRLWPHGVPEWIQTNRS